MTTEDHMKAAFAALLRGDTAERDRQCELVQRALRAEEIQSLERHETIPLVRQPDGTYAPAKRFGQ